MSEVKVNKISPRSGTTITLGDSGDTFTVPSGVTFDASSGGLAGTLTTAAQPNITSVGTLTSFTSTGIDDNATSTAITINSSEQVAFTDGTVSLPSITNSGDTNTGIFFPSADTIAFSQGGVESVRINSSQNVDIVGTTTSSNFIVDGTGYGIKFPLNGTTTLNTNSNSVIFTGSGASGNFLAGTLNLQSRGNLDRAINLITGATAKRRFSVEGSGHVYFYEDTGTTPKMVWNPTSENLSIGSSNSGDENLHIQTSDSTAGTIKLQRGTSGVVLGEAVGELKFATNDTSYTATSGTDEVAKISAVSPNSYGDRYDLAFYTGIYNESTPGERLRITNTGSVGINTTSISPAKIKVVADIGPDGAFVFQQNRTSSASYDMSLYKNNTTQDDNISRYLTCQDNTAGRLIIYGDGDVKNHDNSYGSLSDERIKQDIRDSNSQWNDIKNIRVRNFKKKDDVRQYGENAWEQIGVIAQELETVSPKLIKHSDPTSSDILSDSSFGTLYQEGDEIPEGKNVGDVKEIHQQVKGVSYSVLYMKSIKALQEAMERIETLEAKVQTLENNQP